MLTRTKFKVVSVTPAYTGAIDIRLSGLPDEGRPVMDVFHLASLSLRLSQEQPEFAYLTMGSVVYVEMTSVPPPALKGCPFGARLNAYVAGIKPSNLAAIDTATRSQYERWKAALFVGLGGRYPSFQGARRVVSEGIGYGMLIAVVMADQALFDDLFRVAKTHPAVNVKNPPGGMGELALMNWRIEEGKDPDITAGGWNALDGDLDIAMALLMADRQWGLGVEFEYKACALQTIDAIKRRNITAEGDTLGMNHPGESRLSDQMIGHFRAFRSASNDPFWDKVINQGLTNMEFIQRTYSPATGLLPDFIEATDTTTPKPSREGWGDPGNRPDLYYWNSCRIPLRLSADYLTSGDKRVKDILMKMMDFFVRDTGGQLVNIREGYKLDGTPYVAHNIYWNPAAFVATAAAGAMIDAKYQKPLDDVCAAIVAKPSMGYYDTELELLSLFVLGGNWWNPGVAQ
jgi:endoglucanase